MLHRAMQDNRIGAAKFYGTMALLSLCDKRMLFRGMCPQTDKRISSLHERYAKTLSLKSKGKRAGAHYLAAAKRAQDPMEKAELYFEAGDNFERASDAKIISANQSSKLDKPRVRRAIASLMKNAKTQYESARKQLDCARSVANEALIRQKIAGIANRIGRLELEIPKWEKQASGT
jgi:hypothetical protein